MRNMKKRRYGKISIKAAVYFHFLNKHLFPKDLLEEYSLKEYSNIDLLLHIAEDFFSNLDLAQNFVLHRGENRVCYKPSMYVLCL